MTAVLWIEEPKTCADCPCLQRRFTGTEFEFNRNIQKICNVKGRVIYKNTKKPKWCPLMLLDVEQPYKEKEKKS